MYYNFTHDWVVWINKTARHKRLASVKRFYLCWTSQVKSKSLPDVSTIQDAHRQIKLPPLMFVLVRPKCYVRLRRTGVATLGWCSQDKCSHSPYWAPNCSHPTLVEASSYWTHGAQWQDLLPFSAEAKARKSSVSTVIGTRQADAAQWVRASG